MSNYTMSPVVNGEKKQMIVKVGDTLPIGAIIGFDTTGTIPDGWEYYAENQIKKIAPVTPANGNIKNSYGTSQTDTYSQEYLNRSFMVAKLSSDYTISNTNTNEEIKNFESYNSLGSKFSISNGVIKIGAGVTKVLVGYKANLYNESSTTRTFTYLIHKNNSTNVLTQEASSWNTTNLVQVNLSLPILLDVSEGDEIWLRVYGGAGQKVGTSATRNVTYITIEEVK